MRHWFPKSVIFDRILQMFTANAVPQLVTLLLTPVMARLYSPTQYGEFATFVAVYTLGFVLASGRLELAFDSLKSRRAVIRWTYYLIKRVTVLGAAIGVLFVLVAGLTGNAMLPPAYLAALIVVIPLSSCLAILAAATLRANAFRIVMRQRIYQALTDSFMRIAYGLVAPPVGLLLANMTSMSAGTAMLANAAGALRRPFRRWRRILRSRRRAGRLFGGRSQSEFSWLMVVSSVCQSATLVVMYWAFSGQGEGASLGLFALAQRLFLTPISMIESAITPVVRRYYADQIHAGRDGLKALLKYLSIAAVLASPLAIVLLVPDQFYAAILGDEWSGIATWVNLLVPMAYLQFVTGPVRSSLMVRVELRLSTTYVVAQFLLVLGLVWLAARGVVGVDAIVLGWVAFGCARYLAETVQAIIGAKAFEQHASE